MNKCKYFWGNEVYTLEYSVNEFLKKSPNIEVVSISHAVDNNGHYTAIMIYKEIKRTW